MLDKNRAIIATLSNAAKGEAIFYSSLFLSPKGSSSSIWSVAKVIFDILAKAFLWATIVCPLLYFAHRKIIQINIERALKNDSSYQNCFGIKELALRYPSFAKKLYPALFVKDIHGRAPFRCAAMDDSLKDLVPLLLSQLEGQLEEKSLFCNSLAELFSTIDEGGEALLYYVLAAISDKTAFMQTVINEIPENQRGAFVAVVARYMLVGSLHSALELVQDEDNFLDAIFYNSLYINNIFFELLCDSHNHPSLNLCFKNIFCFKFFQALLGHLPPETISDYRMTLLNALLSPDDKGRPALHVAQQVQQAYVWASEFLVNTCIIDLTYFSSLDFAQRNTFEEALKTKEGREYLQHIVAARPLCERASAVRLIAEKFQESDTFSTLQLDEKEYYLFLNWLFQNMNEGVKKAFAASISRSSYKEGSRFLDNALRCSEGRRFIAGVESEVEEKEKENLSAAIVDAMLATNSDGDSLFVQSLIKKGEENEFAMQLITDLPLSKTQQLVSELANGAIYSEKELYYVRQAYVEGLEAVLLCVPMLSDYKGMDELAQKFCSKMGLSRESFISQVVHDSEHTYPNLCHHMLFGALQAEDYQTVMDLVSVGVRLKPLDINSVKEKDILKLVTVYERLEDLQEAAKFQVNKKHLTIKEKIPGTSEIYDLLGQLRYSILLEIARGANDDHYLRFFCPRYGIQNNFNQCDDSRDLISVEQVEYVDVMFAKSYSPIRICSKVREWLSRDKKRVEFVQQCNNTDNPLSPYTGLPKSNMLFLWLRTIDVVMSCAQLQR